MDGKNPKTLYDISKWGNERGKPWQGWEVGNLPQDLENDWGALKLSLQGKAPIKKIGKDERGWGKNVKPYSTLLGYNTFRNIPHVPPNPSLWKSIWNTKTIPKIDLFLWTLSHSIIQTGENLQKKGWEGPLRYPLCQQAEETSDHLLLNCSYSKEAWKLAVGLQKNLPLP